VDGNEERTKREIFVASHDYVAERGFASACFVLGLSLSHTLTHAHTRARAHTHTSVHCALSGNAEAREAGCRNTSCVDQGTVLLPVSKVYLPLKMCVPFFNLAPRPERTIPTERLSLVGEVSANFCC
jgi:hypothetical protein